MSDRFKSMATDKQIEAIIQQYSAKENVLKILYMSNVSTLLMLETLLEKGATIRRLSGDGFGSYVTLPECSGKTRYSNEMYSFKMHRGIVKRILDNFIKNNPQYFILKPNTNKYAVSYQFIKDFFEINKEKNFEYMNITNILKYIHDPELYEYITKIFYLPFAKNDTWENVKRKYWKEKKPFKVKLKAGETP
jgi:hypothetical protein